MKGDENSARRPGFVEGTRVRLADGQSWALPPRDPARDDPEYDALLAAVLHAEDRAEALRGGLALTIFLLDRNYDLRPEQLSALLTFAPGDPALAALQRDVDRFARESARRAGALVEGGAAAEETGGAVPFVVSSWAKRLGRLWTS